MLVTEPQGSEIHNFRRFVFNSSQNICSITGQTSMVTPVLFCRNVTCKPLSVPGQNLKSLLCLLHFTGKRVHFHSKWLKLSPTSLIWQWAGLVHHYCHKHCLYREENGEVMWWITCTGTVTTLSLNVSSNCVWNPHMLGPSHNVIIPSPTNRHTNFSVNSSVYRRLDKSLLTTHYSDPRPLGRQIDLIHEQGKEEKERQRQSTHALTKLNTALLDEGLSVNTVERMSNCFEPMTYPSRSGEDRSSLDRAAHTLVCSCRGTGADCDRVTSLAHKSGRISRQQVTTSGTLLSARRRSTRAVWHDTKSRPCGCSKQILYNPRLELAKQKMWQSVNIELKNTM